MAVDTSMYNTKPPEPINPLTMATGIAGLQRTGLENQLLGRTMGAQQAVGEAAQGAIGPDGQIDPAAFLTAVKNNPQAAYGAVEAAQNATALQTAQLAQAHEQYGILNSAISSLLSQPNVTQKDIIHQATTLAKEGVISYKMAAAEIGSMPPDNDAQLRPWLENHLAKSLEGQAQVAALIGTPQPVNTGGQTQFVRTPALGATPAPLTNTLSPEAASTPVAGVDAQGHPIAMTRAQFAQRGQIQTGLSPSETAAQNVSGANNAQQGIDLQRAAAMVPDMKGALGNMQGELADFNSGPGADQFKTFKAALLRLRVPGIDPNGVASAEEFNKNAEKLLQWQFGMIGGTGTDAKFNSAMHSNPNMGLSNLGAKGLIGFAKGNADAIALENNIWQKYQQSGGAQSFGQFQNSFNKKYDPRVFAMQYLSNADRAKVYGGMTATEKAEFNKKYDYAVHNGWVPDPRAAQ